MAHFPIDFYTILSEGNLIRASGKRLLMDEGLQIEGEPLKRFRLVCDETPSSRESFDTATEAVEAYVKQQDLYEALDDRKVRPKPKILIFDRCQEITFAQLRVIASQEQ
jgi:hypothetical protein